MRFIPFLSAIGLLSLPVLAQAQDADFNLTFHIERTPAAQLSIETCGSTVSSAAQQAGLSSTQQVFAGQLVSVSGGKDGVGTFIVQCIAVDQTTVSVVQGIDYQAQKGAIGEFADQAFAEVKAAVK